MIAENSIKKIRHAQAMRQKWAEAEHTNSYRIIHGAADGFPGVTLDVFGKSYQLQVFDGAKAEEARQLAEWLCVELNPDFLVIKWRISPDGASLQDPQMEVLAGREDDAQCLVLEHGAFFAVDLLDTINPGLFLDMRRQRQWVKKHSYNKSVLNLFSYTCAFGVQTALGGASETTNVDISGKILRRGENNYSLNHKQMQEVSPLPEGSAPAFFVREDSRKYLDACAKAGKFFDIVVLDPPSFSRNGRKKFSVREEMNTLIAQVLRVLAPGGQALIASNYSRFSPQILASMIREQATELAREVATIRNIRSNKDFPKSEHGGEQGREVALSSVWVSLG
jgi:23S rRNA (cytosine1962-C5)-methyltransferase